LRIGEPTETEEEDEEEEEEVQRRQSGAGIVAVVKHHIFQYWPHMFLTEHLVSFTTHRWSLALHVDGSGKMTKVPAHLATLRFGTADFA
jgi:hypothetical protein